MKATLNNWRRFPALALAAGLTVSSLALHAGSVAIVDPSFEFPVMPPGGFVGGAVGWTTSSAGVWYPASDMGTPPDGNQVGWLNGGTMSQVLSDTLQPDTIYTLNIDVGGRFDGLNPGTDYSVSLWAGSNWLASVTPVTPIAGGWTDLSATYATGGSVLGGNLGIVISTNSVQLDVDDVRLDTSPVRSVPDEGNVTWVAVLSLATAVWMRRRASGAGAVVHGS